MFYSLTPQKGAFLNRSMFSSCFRFSQSVTWQRPSSEKGKCSDSFFSSGVAA